MTNKIVRFDSEVREKIKKGIDTLTRAVKTTMGPKGKTVIIEREMQHPIITKDGVTVAKAINLANKFENLGVQVVKEAASRSAEEAGDGTTTATVLTQAIYEEGLKLIASGYDSVLLRKGIELAVSDVIEKLSDLKKDIKSESEIEQIAMVSCNGEKEIAQLITKAINEVGFDGSVLVEEAKGFKSDLHLVEGVNINRGYLSPYFITDQDKMHALLENCHVLLLNKKVTSIKEMIQPLEICLETGYPILVIANEIDNEALQGLVLNRVQGNLKVCAIKSPGFGNSRYDMLYDLSTLTGATVYGETDDLKNITVEDLGKCKKIIVSRDNTLFVATDQDNKELEKRIKVLQQKIEAEDLELEELKILKYRIHQLKGKIAVLRVGASTEAEMIERRDRVDDALSATRAALKEGILPGGGTALIKASTHLKSCKDDHEPGYRIVAKACEAPFRQIVKNSGKSDDLILQKVLDMDVSSAGYDARSEQFGDMFEMGIIDPHKVVRCAIENASSAATLLLTSDCAMVDE